MGRRNSETEQRASLTWAETYAARCIPLADVSLDGIKAAFYQDLRRYFALAALSRSSTASEFLVTGALQHVFRVRVQIEKSIFLSLDNRFRDTDFFPDFLLAGNFYGCSKKQGVSVRFALLGCNATSLCASACYAHDALDTAPASVIRGALNHYMAGLFERRKSFRKIALLGLQRHTQRAVAAAIAEADDLDCGWEREPRIRFAHVGEAAAHPEFSNSLARQVRELSDGRVKCVTYTRHRNAKRLDPELFIINFTVDSSSENRRAWAPDFSRVVYSAFGGKLSTGAEVNFLEHHRWSHFKPVGEGRICPATKPEAVNLNCDAARCDLCFREPVSGNSYANV